MSKSLQEQLMSLGLAQKSADKSARHKSAKGKSRASAKNRSGPAKSRSPKNHAAQSDEEIALAKAYALRQQEEKREVEATRKAKQAEDRRRRQLNIALKAIVKEHRLNDAGAEVPRNFMYKGRIRKINLTPDQLKALNRGELGIVYLLGGYHLLAKEHVEAARQLSADHVPDLSGTAEDDEEFPVPDDLVW